MLFSYRLNLYSYMLFIIQISKYISLTTIFDMHFHTGGTPPSCYFICVRWRIQGPCRHHEHRVRFFTRFCYRYCCLVYVDNHLIKCIYLPFVLFRVILGIFISLPVTIVYYILLGLWSSYEYRCPRPESACQTQKTCYTTAQEGSSIAAWRIQLDCSMIIQIKESRESWPCCFNVVNQ